MTIKTPTSLNVFFATVSITALVIFTAIGFAYFRVDPKYAKFLALFLFLAGAFSTVGIYTGIRYKSENSKGKVQNLIGLIGNLLIFLFFVAMMVKGAMASAAN